VNVYTIGFAGKSAEEFFGLLCEYGVDLIVDIRVNPRGQLAGFAKQRDLPYFLRELVSGCAYVYLPELAPSKEMLAEYRADPDWPRYVDQFESLLDQRDIPSSLDPAVFAGHRLCLLCSEPSPAECHRRLVAQRLAANWPEVQVVHL
jgi:uncharacterized protein (DUF488 family)